MPIITPQNALREAALNDFAAKTVANLNGKLPPLYAHLMQQAENDPHAALLLLNALSQRLCMELAFDEVNTVRIASERV